MNSPRKEEALTEILKHKKTHLENKTFSRKRIF
jgi:hypothetical protein